MIWVRKAIVHLLSLLLFVSLIFGAFSASIILNLSHPAKIETWLTQSNLYNGFVSTVIKQGLSSSSNGNDNGSGGGISLSDSAVQQAAESAFSPALLQKDVNIFLDSNYAWLEGKTATPNFTIDLTQAKQSFAQQVGGFVQAHLASLPVCTTAQASAMGQNIDPLTVACRPANISPVTEGANATTKLSDSDGFLSNPVITADTFNPNSSNSNIKPSQPYYQKLSFAPKAYRAATKLPLEIGGFALLCMIGIFFIAPRKRKGLRRIGIVFIEAGIILIVEKFAADMAFKKFVDKAFNNSSIGALQQSLTNFAQHVESHIFNVNMYIGIGLAAVAIIIFTVLISTHSRSPKQPKPIDTAPDEGAPIGSPQASTAQSASTKKQAIDVIGAKKPASTAQSSTTKRPRLIQ